MVVLSYVFHGPLAES